MQSSVGRFATATAIFSPLFRELFTEIHGLAGRFVGNQRCNKDGINSDGSRGATDGLKEMPQNPSISDSSFELKHRIVGALILIILGVVIFPMILSGPKPAADLALNDSAAENPDTKVFISKITPIGGATPDLKRESTRDFPDTTPESRPAAEPKAVATPKPAVKSAVASPAAEKKKQVPDAAKKKTSTPNKARKAERTASAKATTKPLDNTVERGWIVRIGTFSQPENAARIMNSLKALGFKPSSERVKTSRGLLTRVWVGPYAQRVEAGRVRSRIQQATGEKGLIAAYP